MATTKIQVWDLPLRAFHWLLVLTVLVAYITAELGGLLTDWHGRIGGFALGLLVFRLIWGFLGTTHARFANFVPTPSRLIAYLKGNWQAYGHNPLGALSVLALLGTLTVLLGTGLFANDDIAFQGPLFSLVNKSQSDWLTGLHAISFNVLLTLIVLHIVAIAYYFFFKKTNLVKPMVTGDKDVAHDVATKTTGGGKLRFLITSMIALVVVWGIFGGTVVEYFVPTQTIPVNTSTPSW